MSGPSAHPTDPRERCASAQVDPRAEVGSSSTRPSLTGETDSDVELDALALEQILDELTEQAMVLLDEAGFGELQLDLSMEVRYGQP